MSITNINAFESRVDNKSFLTDYTNEYLRQSLANLGQRLSVKGDSIVNGEFKISDLFPNYLGDFSQDGLVAEFTWSESTDDILGKLVSVINENGIKDGTRRDVGSIGNSVKSDANSKFTIKNSDNTIKGLNDDDYPGEIRLSDSIGVNDTSYWHKNSAVISKQYDSKLKKDVLIYKVVGHHDDSIVSYDNEYIVEEISLDGEFIDGLRIFISNEDDIMTGKSSEENLVMFRVQRNPEYTKANSENQHKWIFTAYKANSNEFEIGDLTADDYTDDLWFNINNTIDKNGDSTPSDIVSNLVELLTEDNMIFYIGGKPLFSKCYSLYVDDDTEKNPGWSVASFSQIKDDVRIWTDSIKDEDIVEQKLEFFTNDIKQLFPLVLSVYNDVMYKDDTNLKLKQQIIAQLLLRLKNDVGYTDGDYTMIFPTDYVIKYKFNSNDSSIIYGSSSSIAINFCNLGNDETKEYGLVESFNRISNSVDENGNIRKNDQIALANGYISKYTLYDFSISYIENCVISSIDWSKSFTLPYIDEKGYWTINDIITDQYAMASPSNDSGLVFEHCSDKSIFIAEDSIMFGPEHIKSWAPENWEKKYYDVEYIDSDVNVGGSQTFTMSAWLPSDKYLKSIYGSSEYSYISNALFVCSSSMEMEKDSTYTNIIYTGPNSNNVYKTTYSKDSIYSLYWDNETPANSYIYTIDTKKNSLTYLLGKDTVMTSMWACQKTIVNNVPHYEMTYIKRPGKNTALDFAYLASLENYINHYASSSFSPDNYLHHWLVFTKADSNLKNNTLEDKTIYPVIRNYNSTYFSTVMSSNTRAFGDNSAVTKNELNQSNGTELQYKNNLNLSVEFTDKLKTENGKITDTTNSFAHRHFDIGEYTYTYQEAIQYTALDKDGNQTTKVMKKDVEKRYGTIPRSIPYTNYPNEYSPNAIYDANNSDAESSYQYPILDLAEVLARNVNTLNRYNIIGVDNRTFQNGVNKTVLWNAYMGFGWDEDTDKSHLKIGTSNVNPNLGTTTMIHNESQSRLTPVETLDIDLTYVNISGDVNISGNLRVANQEWNYTDMPMMGTKVYSTVVTPVGECSSARVTDFDNVAYTVGNYINSGITTDVNSSIFHTLELDENNSAEIYKSKYYSKEQSKNHKMIYRKSYLNVVKLLDENGVNINYNTIINGDKSQITKRELKTDLDVLLKFVGLEESHPGVFAEMMNWYMDDDNEGKLPDSDWFDKLKTAGIGDDDNIDAIIRSTIQNNIKRINKVDGGYVWGYRKTTEDGGAQDVIEYSLVDDLSVKEWDTIDNIENRKQNGYTPTPGSGYEIDTVGAEFYDYGWFLELSTDMSAEENKIGDGKDYNKIIVGNPIQLSYIDIKDGKEGEYSVTENTKIYCYAYVCKYDDITDDYYDLEPSTHGGYDISSKDISKYAYNEVWTCDGCDKCSSFSCKLIGICNKSKVKGCYMLSYGFFTCDSNEMTDIENKMNKHVYRYPHKRYGKNQDGTSYEYITYSYYPRQRAIYVGSYPENERIEKLKCRTNDGKTLVLNSSNYFEEYKKGLTVLASYVYVGSNILCGSTDDYIYNNGSAIDEYSRYEVYDTDPSMVRIASKDGSFNEYFAYVKNIPLVWKSKNSIVIDKSNSTSGETEYYDNAYWSQSSRGYMHFSYTADIEVKKKYKLSTRYINIREITTGNSTPTFFADKCETSK